MADQPDCLTYMTDVKATLISQNLQFRKIHRLPRSRWAQMKDRVINVPVPCGNIKNTISSLPRNPTDSGLIAVNWKRKVLYKNTHKSQLVDVNRIFDALEYLVQHNPLYKDSSIDRDFINRCQTEDTSGHEAFIADNDDENMNRDENEILNDPNGELGRTIEAEEQLSDSDNEPSAIEREDEDYNNFATTDPIRRFQFDYDEHVALSNDNPAAALDGHTLTKTGEHNVLSVAPGEGQIATSVLTEREWDIKTYPHLFPDGKNGINAEGREVKLTNQQSIIQKLLNVDKRFANDPGYLFSATWYIESFQLERNISMGYSHGARKAGSSNI